MTNETKPNCCDHGGKRIGCGRKPGIKTQPIRLPEWLLTQLSLQGDPKQLILQACLAQYPAVQQPEISNECLKSND